MQVFQDLQDKGHELISLVDGLEYVQQDIGRLADEVIVIGHILQQLAAELAYLVLAKVWNVESFGDQLDKRAKIVLRPSHDIQMQDWISDCTTQPSYQTVDQP